MTSQLEELPENRVRLTVDVPRHDLQHAVEHAASDLAGSVKIPGFRQGKVPMPVLLARVGKERLLTEAVESHIGGWFWNAAARERIHPVAQPEYDFDLPESEAEDWRFTATVEVQPSPELVDWTTLEVPRAEAEVPDDLVDHELNVLRGTVAELAPVEGRPAQEADTVVLDMVTAGGTEAQRDYVVELGEGRLVDELEQGVVGMSAGETRELQFPRGDDEPAIVEVTVKEIKEKVLPPLDDELARAASEFETLDELRSSLVESLRGQIEDEVEGRFRAAAVDRLVEASNIQAAGPLVESRARELLNAFVRSIERRGVSFENYLRLTGGSADELVQQIRAEAAHSVARELALDAVAEQLGIEVSDDEVRELIREQAEEAGDDPDDVIARMWDQGAHESLRTDLRLRKALDRLAAEVQPIPLEVAAAREKLWTPEQEKTPADTKLWTPGSKEPA